MKKENLGPPSTNIEDRTIEGMQKMIRDIRGLRHRLEERKYSGPDPKQAVKKTYRKKK